MLIKMKGMRDNMQDYTCAIPELLFKKYKVKQIRWEMYDKKNIYSNVANVTFYLEESSSSDQSYIEISNVLESYKGKLKWVLKKSIGSRYNYSIIPEIIYKVDKDNFDKLNKKFVRAKDLLDEKTYRKICDLAIQDIPHLYEYLLMQL